LRNRARHGQHDIDGSPLPAGGGAFCNMMGTVPAAWATREKNAMTASRSVMAFGRHDHDRGGTLIPCTPRHASLTSGSTALPPTTNEAFPRASSATTSDKRARSSGDNVSNSLATPGEDDAVGAGCDDIARERAQPILVDRVVGTKRRRQHRETPDSVLYHPRSS
jgi:hypothetical protein